METERLLLRRFRREDLQDLYEYLSDEETLRFEPYLPMDIHEAERELAERMESDEMIAVELKSSGKLIGNLYLGKRLFLEGRRWQPHLEGHLCVFSFEPLKSTSP